MATYKTIDLMNQISQVLNDGYHFVDVYECDSDKEHLPSLSFEVPDFDIEYDDVVSLSEETVKFNLSPDDYIAAFSFNEIALLHHAVTNSLEYGKECLNDPSYSKEDKDKIKSFSVKLRNLQAKLIKILKTYQ